MNRVLLRLVRRAGFAALTVGAVLTITFALSHVVPADPALFLGGRNASHEQLAAIRTHYGLDLPIWQQYAAYMVNVAQGDLGTSIRTGRPVAQDLGAFLPATLELLLIAFGIYLVLAVGLGFLSAHRRGGLVDRGTRVGTIVGTAVPVYWLAVVFQLVFFLTLRWLPLEGRLGTRDQAPPTVTGFYTIDAVVTGHLEALGPTLSHMALPVAVLVLSLLAVGTRLIRDSLVGEMDSQYVRAARGKGLGERLILYKHVFRNAMNPVLTVTGTQFGYMVSWIVVVEVVFNWPGIGLYAYRSFNVFDYNPILALALVSTLVFVVVNLVLEAIYPIVDPRILRQ